MMIPKRLILWYSIILATTILAIIVIEIIEIRRKSSEVSLGKRHKSDFSHEMAEVFIVGIPMLLLVTGNAYWTLKKVLLPIKHLTQAVEKIHEGNLDEKLTRTGMGDELDRLREVFNSMTTRLSDSFQRVREFTLRASHELKTPLTIIHAELEILLRDYTLTESQRNHLSSQLEEVRRLAKIIDSLTLLTKVDTGLIHLNREAVQLDELLQEIFVDAQILANPLHVQVSLTTCENLTIVGDCHWLRQLLLNLVDNAIKYNRMDGIVTLGLRCTSDKFAEIRIVNTGDGIPIELQSRLFEPFFRYAQNKKVEGCGLGLSLVRWIVHAHHGKIELTSQPQKYTTVIVCLPMGLQAAAPAL